MIVRIEIHFVSWLVVPVALKPKAKKMKMKNKTQKEIEPYFHTLLFRGDAKELLIPPSVLH